MTLKKIKEIMRPKNENRWSVRARYMLFGALIPAVWFHLKIFIIILSISLITNPFWFKAKEENNADIFMTLAKKGEKLWFERSGGLNKFFFFLFSTLLLIEFFLSLWNRNAILSMILFSGIFILKTAFVWYTARLAKREMRLNNDT